MLFEDSTWSLLPVVELRLRQPCGWAVDCGLCDGNEWTRALEYFEGEENSPGMGWRCTTAWEGGVVLEKKGRGGKGRDGMGWGWKDEPERVRLELGDG